MARTVFFALRRTRVAAALALVALPATLGCASSDGLKKQITGLETQITAMRADQDRLEERLAAVELSSPVPSHGGPSVSGAPRTSLEHPRLKVIHLSPDQVGSKVEPVDGPSSAAPESAGPRPSIRGSGERIIKTGDVGGDESTLNDETPSRSVAQLGKSSRGN